MILKVRSLLESIIVLLLTGSFTGNKTSMKIGKLEVKGKVITVRLATTPEEWIKGLMLECPLSDEQGMLFIFPEERILRFWMKHTPFDLSVAYIDRNGTIFEIHNLKAYSTKVVESKKLGKFALEVSSGWFERYGVSVGDTIKDVLKYDRQKRPIGFIWD